MKEISEKLANELYRMIELAERESAISARHARNGFASKAEFHAISASVAASEARLHLLWHMEGHLNCEQQAAPEELPDEYR